MGCDARCFRSCSTAPASPSTSVASAACSPARSAARWYCATAAVPGPTVTVHRGGRRPPRRRVAEGGETCLANAVLLCGFHHREIHRPNGWTVHIAVRRAAHVRPARVDRPRAEAAAEQVPPETVSRCSRSLLSNDADEADDQVAGQAVGVVQVAVVLARAAARRTGPVPRHARPRPRSSRLAEARAPPRTARRRTSDGSTRLPEVVAACARPARTGRSPSVRDGSSRHSVVSTAADQAAQHVAAAGVRRADPVAEHDDARSAGGRAPAAATAVQSGHSRGTVASTARTRRCGTPTGGPAARSACAPGPCRCPHWTVRAAARLPSVEPAVPHR